MKRGLGAGLIQLAAALYLLADGILGFTEKTLWQRLGLALGSSGATGSEIADTLTQVFGTGDLAKTLMVLFSILAIAGGVFLFLELFGIRFAVVDIIILVFLAVWVAFIALSDVVYAFKDTRNFVFLPWLKALAAHLVVLGALVSASHKFGD
jgi:hypothetical protein